MIEGLCDDADPRVRDCAAKALAARPAEQPPARPAKAAEDAEDVDAEGIEVSAGNAGGDEKGGGLLKRLFGRLSE
ncbi:MAG: hypothetical protein IKR62_08470 [Victivallales bacterium]|nr:hypothetical protein [Victivallales bacterium]